MYERLNTLTLKKSQSPDRLYYIDNTLKESIAKCKNISTALNGVTSAVEMSSHLFS